MYNALVLGESIPVNGHLNENYDIEKHKYEAVTWDLDNVLRKSLRRGFARLFELLLLLGYLG